MHISFSIFLILLQLFSLRHSLCAKIIFLISILFLLSKHLMSKKERESKSVTKKNLSSLSAAATTAAAAKIAADKTSQTQKAFVKKKPLTQLIRRLDRKKERNSDNYRTERKFGPRKKTVQQSGRQAGKTVHSSHMLSSVGEEEQQQQENRFLVKKKVRENSLIKLYQTW